MTTRQKIWTWVGSGIALTLMAGVGVVGNYMFNSAPASAASGDFVTRVEMDSAMAAVHASRRDDLKALSDQIATLSNKLDARFEKISDAQQATRETIAGLSADVRNLRRDQWRQGERIAQ